jgi:regulatory protein RepA
VNVRIFFTEEAPSPEFILPNFPVGSVGSLLGAPSSGKTLFALELCCAVACSLPGEGNLLGLPVQSSGSVYYLNAEDSETDIHRMVHAIGMHLSPEARKSIERELHIDVGVGTPQDIIDDECRNGIIELCRNSKLVVFDALSRFHTLDESNRNSAARLVGALDNIARETGASVLCLDHPDPVSRLADRIRWRARLRLMKEEEGRCFSEDPQDGLSLNQNRKKIEPHRYFSELWITDPFFSNFGTINWFKFADGGVLLPAQLYSTEQV